jgi:2-polyprenyl-6-methoxyphenol hydroxylase-like FAD-dependent oxidoreductase
VLQDLDALMLERAKECGATIEWEHKVVGVGQDGDKVWAEVEAKGEDGQTVKKRVEGDYLVGCDGANSTVRKSLFGSEFPGYTWDAQIIATNVSWSRLSRLGSWGLVVVVVGKSGW